MDYALFRLFTVLLFFALIYCNINWAVVVAQLVEQFLPVPEVRGSNPVIGKNLFTY